MTFSKLKSVSTFARLVDYPTVTRYQEVDGGISIMARTCRLEETEFLGETRFLYFQALYQFQLFDDFLVLF